MPLAGTLNFPVFSFPEPLKVPITAPEAGGGGEAVTVVAGPGTVFVIVGPGTVTVLVEVPDDPMAAPMPTQASCGNDGADAFQDPVLLLRRQFLTRRKLRSTHMPAPN